MYYHPFAGIRCKTQTSTTKKGIVMNDEINDRSVNPLIRIADALEEIIRMVKEDQERSRKYMEERKDDE
jgi:hypothetical protein